MLIALMLELSSSKPAGFAAGRRNGGKVDGAERERRARWYLLRTKPGEERRAQDQVSRLAAEVILPMTRGRVRRWSRVVESITPLFPGYLFALLDLEDEHRRLRYTRGLRGIVCFGEEPAVVAERIIGELKQRCAQGPVELPGSAFAAGERVMLVDGPFGQFEALFERYLSSGERVAVLLSMLGAGTRATIPARMVVSAA
jgi:transcriptional antiterminator RfaH